MDNSRSSGVQDLGRSLQDRTSNLGQHVTRQRPDRWQFLTAEILAKVQCPTRLRLSKAMHLILHDTSNKIGIAPLSLIHHLQ